MGEWISEIPDNVLAQWRDDRANRAWPSPNTRRALGGFWYPNAGRDPAPISSHYLVRFAYREDPDDVLWVDHQLEPSGEFECYSDSGVNADGQRLQMFSRNQDVPSGEHDVVGIEWEFVYDREGFADTVHAFAHWRRQDVGFLFGPVPFDADWPRPGGTAGPVFWTIEGETGDTDWEINSLFAHLRLIFMAAPERFNVPRPPFEPNAAEAGDRPVASLR